MGECLIFRKGGETSSPPVLDASYPKDLNLAIIEGNTVSADFNVSIATPGTPAVYTYQWYVNGVKVSDANSSIFVMTGLSSSATYSVYCEVTNKAGIVTSRIATLRVEEYKKPILNASYPADVTVMESTNGNSATFKISIATDGNPATYTYQWYVNDSAVSGATSSVYTASALTSVATYRIYCEVTNKAGTVTSRVATLKVLSSMPSYTYSGSHEFINDGNHNWRIKLKSTGTLNFTNLGNGNGNIDIFCVGGGGGGYLSGGGGGYTQTAKGKTITANTNYSVTVGGGGGAGVNGGNSSFANLLTANGGKAGTVGGSGRGGDGGSGGGDFGGVGRAGNGGSNGSNGAANWIELYDSSAGWYWAEDLPAGQGQGTTTTEFGEGGTLYAGGGGGGSEASNTKNTGGYAGSGGGGQGACPGYASTAAATAGATNTGGGGGGGNNGSYDSKPGGSGIVIIRNHR